MTALGRARTRLIALLLLLVLMMLTSINATPITHNDRPRAAETPNGPAYTLPHRSASLAATAVNAGSKCGAVSGGWQADYGGVRTSVQQLDDVNCVLLAAQYGHVTADNASAISVMGIDSTSGAVLWQQEVGPYVTWQYYQGGQQAIWLDTINQRLYVSAVYVFEQQRCSWVAAFNYRGTALPLWLYTQDVLCQYTTQHFTDDMFVSELLLWPWSDNGGASGAPIGVVAGTGEWSWYGLTFTNASLAVFHGISGGTFQQYDTLLTGGYITVAACGDADELGNVQRLVWYQGQYMQSHGAAAVYEVYRNSSVQQIGRTLVWAVKSALVTRRWKSDATCLLVLEWSPQGNYSATDIATGKLLWTNETGAEDSSTHPLNSSLLVLADISVDAKQWTIVYVEAATGRRVAQSPTIAFGQPDWVTSSWRSPICHFDVTGVLYTEYYVQFIDQLKCHTWFAFDSVSLQLINSGPTVDRDGLLGFRPLSIDQKAATAMWVATDTPSSVYTAALLNMTTHGHSATLTTAGRTAVIQPTVVLE